MLARRIIPCLDVRDGVVVKGVQFKDHEVVGDILALAARYRAEGADELVFYDIAASADNKTIAKAWVEAVSRELDIPFCVAGGIRTLDDAAARLEAGADKISVNSPALEKPDFIDDLVKTFGTQCVVVGIDSYTRDGDYHVWQYTGRTDRMREAGRLTADWAREVVERGAGEIVLNCMNQDGVRKGYDLKQLRSLRNLITVPLIASGGAGKKEDFWDVFQKADVDGALAASVFHKELIGIPELKEWLKTEGIEVRI